MALEKLSFNSKRFVPEKETPSYTLIIHKARKMLGLTISEYCVADIIYKFSNRPESKKMGGWCFATKETIARALSLNKRTVEMAIKRMIGMEKPILEKDPETKYLATTGRWYYAVEVERNKIKRSGPEFRT